MKIAVIGSRTFDNYELLCKSLDTFYPKITQIISGGALGADSLAERFAKEQGISTLIFKPDWEKYGKVAGFIRNKDIVESADIVVAFWNGVSKGTFNSIDHAYKMKKSVIIVPDFM